MDTGQVHDQTVRQELERVLSSAGFSANERLSRFLRFVVERHLEGRDLELKESLIGVEVFGRKPGYDPQQDAIVRTEAGRLRARLLEYYANEGAPGPLVIEVPKGGYIPLFRPLMSPRQESKPRRGKLWLMVALAGFVAVAAGTGWWWLDRDRSESIAIAVLPLENLSHDPANDYFTDGLTAETIRSLSIIEGLSVRSQTSSFAFKGKPRNVQEAGAQLQANYLLEGSVLRAGQQIRVNIQLVRVRDDFLIWSGKYDRELTDIFAIQDEISRGIVNSLRLKLGRGRRRYETSKEAYDLYLRARALGNSRESIGPYEEAISKDPSFAPAYAGLSATYAYRSGTFGDDREDLAAKMRTTAEKAIQLDPLLAEAHDALAIAYAREGQWETSEKSFRHAIELDPNRSMTYKDFVMYLLFPLGRIEEAIHQLRVAEKADQLSPDVHFAMGMVLLSAGRYDGAAGYCQKLPAGYPDKVECLGRALLGQGRTVEAIQVLSEAPNPRYLGYAYGRAGRRAEAEKLAEAMPRPFPQALIFAGLGDKERTMEAVERLAVQGPVRLGRNLTYPEFALIRGDPRLKALRKKVGLPE